MSNCFAESIGKISSDLNIQNHRCGGAHDEHHHFSKRKCSENFCILTIWKQLHGNGFERSGRGQEPSRGHKFSILENFLSIRDFTSAMRLHFRSDLVGACLPQPLLRADEEELYQSDTIPPRHIARAFAAVPVVIKYNNIFILYGFRSQKREQPFRSNRHALLRSGSRGHRLVRMPDMQSVHPCPTSLPK